MQSQTTSLASPPNSPRPNDMSLGKRKRGQPTEDDESMAGGQHSATSRKDTVATHPTRRADGTLICTHPFPLPTCAALVFERPCEWKKHMDKHDRPHRCLEPSCVDLKGFTYPGGLLRHEREVHGKGGAPKLDLRCPVAYCKRHTGPGFTRRENLNEHIKRLHRNTSKSLDRKEEERAASEESEQNVNLKQPPIHIRDSVGPSASKTQETLSLLPPKKRKTPILTFGVAKSLALGKDVTSAVRTETPEKIDSAQQSDAELRLEVEGLRKFNGELSAEVQRMYSRVSMLEKALQLLTDPNESGAYPTLPSFPTRLLKENQSRSI